MEAAFAAGNPHVRASIDVMRQASADTRGTVQTLAAEVDSANTDGEQRASHIMITLQRADCPSQWASLTLFRMLLVRGPCPPNFTRWS
jgi:hypothetical protein